MKKTLLAAATLSALMASGMANAAFTDADGSGGWTGNLEFNGTITNTNPAWKYQIPEATIAGAKNWNAERTSGAVDGNNTNFSFAENLTVLEGVMKAPVNKQSSGMQPVITFGDGTKVVWDTTTQSKPKSLSITAKKDASSVGSLSMQLTFQVATQARSDGNDVNPDSEYPAVAKAYQLLKAQPYYAGTYGNRNQVLILSPTGSQTTTIYGEPSKSFPAASALVADASNFKLTVPTASIPDAWTATLPISITVK